jgi:hypothetical protein
MLADYIDVYFQSLLDWASRSKDSGRAVEIPREFMSHLLEEGRMPAEKSVPSKKF